MVAEICSVPERRGHLHLAGGGAHAVAAAEEAVDGFDDVGGEDLRRWRRPMKCVWPPGSSISEKARLARTMRRSGREVTTPLGMVSMHGLELARGAAARAALACGELAVECSAARGRSSRSAAMALKLRTSSPSSSVADCGDAVGVVAGGDGLHGVGEGFDGRGDLLGEIEREPAAGEEREAGHQEQKSM